jgi:hypothetical protein
MDIKSFTGLEVKDADRGLVSAVFSTFGVVDHDNDIIEAGAVKDGTPIRVSAYGHTSWGGILPVGKGIVHADGEKAWADMEFFLETSHGRDTFLTVKGMGELQEWSYSLHNLTYDFIEIDGEQVRRIKSLDIHEVSPVLMAASIGTHTTSVKSGMKLQEHISAVVADAAELNRRVQEVVALRAQKGRRMSEVSHDLLEQLEQEMKTLDQMLRQPTDDEVRAEALREYLRFVRLTS